MAYLAPSHFPYHQQQQQLLSNDSKRPLFQRIHEALNKQSLYYQDICAESGIDAVSLDRWLESDPNYEYTAVEQSLEKWLLSKQPNQSTEDKEYYQIRSSYLRRLEIGSSSANQWLPVSEQQSDHLIPISIDIEFEQTTFKENIVWNYFEPYFTPENFARHLAKENRLSPYIEQEIVSAIRRAIQNYRIYEPKEQELIRTIELNILIENVQLKDRFDWDINDSSNSPEIFALNMASELGLSGEFAQRIAYQIHEQIASYQKQIIEKRSNIQAQNVKKSTRSLIESSVAYSNFDSKYQLQGNTLITPENYLRPLITDNDFETFSWEPKIQILAPEDIRKVQKEEQRKQRLMRRTR